MPLTIDSVTGNATDGSIDIEMSGAPIGARIDIERRIISASRDDARAIGVPEGEVVAEYTVTKNHPLTTGAGTWQDRKCRADVNYEYRARDVGLNTWTGWEG